MSTLLDLLEQVAATPLGDLDVEDLDELVAHIVADPDPMVDVPVAAFSSAI